MTRKQAEASDSSDAQTVYAFEDYKLAIRSRVSQLKRTKKTLTLRKLADRLSIQHTYLSRCLNGDKAHLSEDHIFSLGRLLDLLPEEIDHLLLLRSYACTGDVHRKEMLFGRIDAARRSRLGSAEQKEFRYEDLQAEAAYLFTPLAVVVHVALFIKEYRVNPRALCTLLGITVDRLKEVLRILDQSDYIVIADKDPLQVIEVKSKYPHFGREHPLMRAHQATLKTLLQSRLQQTSESDKESFMVTFSMDEKGFGRVRDEFKKFVSQIQQISTEGQHHHVYQMSFDFLRWI
ncbi:hypothetical protein BH10BDE1_BH10BDE1_36250 [soil metagenome]